MEPITELAVLAALPPKESNSFLRNYVEYAADCTDAHLSYHVLAGLTALAQACPIDLSFPFGMPMHSNVYGLCVGRSSDSRKSHAISVVRDILDHAIPGTVGEVPGSKENLVKTLCEKPKQLIIYPEFGTFLSATERSSYLAPLKTAYTEAWDGSPLGRGLVKQENTEAKFPRLSLLAGSTLEYLERHSELADWTGGFMARFIVMYPDRQRLETVPPGSPAKRPEVIAQLQHIARSCVFGMQRGACLGFSSDARSIWDDWYRGVVMASKSTEETAGLVARSHSHALRIALLLGWDFGHGREGHDWYITPNVLLPALAITKLHLQSVERVGANLSGSKDMRDRRAVLRTIQKSPTSLGEVVSNSRLLLRRVKEILESLNEEGVIESITSTELRGQHFKLKGPPIPELPTEYPEIEGGGKVLQFSRPSPMLTDSNASAAVVGGVLSFDSPVASSDAIPLSWGDGDDDEG